jgi:hypothetical protein
MPKRKTYIVGDGFIVNGQPAGSVLEEDAIEHLDAMLASGRVIPVQAESSGKMKPVTRDASEEDAD